MMRLAILGMNNPLSSDPMHALWPDPPGCAGHRLWTMASSRSGISKEEWLELTDRRNLLDGDFWDVREARLASEDIRTWAIGRTTLLLGGEVASAMGHTLPPLEWAADQPWVRIPHPSGRNLWYNNEACVAAVEVLLLDLIHMCGWRGSTSALAAAE